MSPFLCPIFLLAILALATSSLGTRLDLDDLGLFLLKLVLGFLDLVLEPRTALGRQSDINMDRNVTHISLLMKSRRPLTVLSASTLSCFNSTGPVSL